MWAPHALAAGGETAFLEVTATDRLMSDGAGMLLPGLVDPARGWGQQPEGSLMANGTGNSRWPHAAGGTTLALAVSLLCPPASARVSLNDPGNRVQALEMENATPVVPHPVARAHPGRPRLRRGAPHHRRLPGRRDHDRRRLRHVRLQQQLRLEPGCQSPAGKRLAVRQVHRLRGRHLRREVLAAGVERGHPGRRTVNRC